MRLLYESYYVQIVIHVSFIKVIKTKNKVTYICMYKDIYIFVEEENSAFLRKELHNIYIYIS